MIGRKMLPNNIAEHLSLSCEMNGENEQTQENRSLGRIMKDLVSGNVSPI